MHSSARRELKTGLAESRIETKLPINKCGLLHVCLSDGRDSYAGALVLVMQEELLFTAGAHDRADGDARDHALSLGGAG
jgi:hypothetical protein